MAQAKPATVDSFGRVLIPKHIRQAMGLRAGSQVEIRHDASGLRLIPREQGVLLKRVDAFFVLAGEATGDLVSAVVRARGERSRRLVRGGG